MSEPPKPQRKFWQFHLSTMMLLSIVVAGLLYVFDHGPLYGEREDGKQVVIGVYHADGAECKRYGWPIVCVATVSGKSYWGTADVVFNAVSAFWILGTMAVFSEWLIRRRKARKT